MAELLRKLHLAIKSKNEDGIRAAVMSGAEVERTFGAHGSIFSFMFINIIEVVRLP